MSHMFDEIHEQPEVISRLAREEWENVRKIADEIRRRNADLIVMVARGTSDHAAIYGKYLLEIANGYPVALADCSVFTLYSAKIRLDRAVVIGISQSGQATDVIEYLEQAKAIGAYTIGITNEPGSKLAEIPDASILCHAGKEIAVAATKTYTATLGALYLLSTALTDGAKGDEMLASCSEAIASALKLNDYIADRAERYRYMQGGAVIARGYNYCTALETALKLAETCYVGMRGYSAADFLHGPIASIHEGDPCILAAPQGKTYDMMLNTANRLHRQKADTLILSSSDDILAYATVPVKLDVDVCEELSPLVYIVPGQLLAYHLSLARGYNPDQPRGLNKVTLTR